MGSPPPRSLAGAGALTDGVAVAAAGGAASGTPAAGSARDAAVAGTDAAASGGGEPGDDGGGCGVTASADGGGSDADADVDSDGHGDGDADAEDADVDAAEEFGSDAERAAAVSELWQQLSAQLPQTITDGRPEVRHGAVRTQTGAHGAVLNAAAWRGCVRRALLPL